MHVLPLGGGHSVMGKGNREHEKTVENRCGSRLPVSAGRMRAARQAGGGGSPARPGRILPLCRPACRRGGEPEAMAAPVAYRAMWVSYLEWPMFDTSGAQGFAASVGSLLDNCAALGLNTVIVQVRPFRGRGVPQRSVSLEPPCNGRAGQDPGYDPLAIFVEQAHARGLAIEAWVNPYRVRLNDTMPPASWRRTTRRFCTRAGRWRRTAGCTTTPLCPEVQDMVVQGVTEIVQNYDVDGIQFDDYFYPTTDEAFDTESYARYGGGDRTWPNGGAPTSTRWCRRYTPPSRR